MTREIAQELDNLRYVVVVFSVLRARLRIKEVVTSEKFKYLVLLAFE